MAFGNKYSHELRRMIMKRKWWHDKVAYQIYPKSFLIPMAMESEIFRVLYPSLTI